MRSEEDLVKAVARGEEYALEILFECHYESLWKYVLVILKNRDDALEIVNDTFFRAYRYARTFAGEGAFAGWLFRIARNLCMDRLKKRDKFVQAVPDVQRFPQENSSGLNPAGKKIMEELDNIKQEYREVIILKDIVGYSIKEISQITGKTTSAVKTLHHRALKKLRERVKSSEKVTG